MNEANYPEWLDADYFREILSRKLKNSALRVLSVRVEPCCATGDGFLSTLLRAQVDYFHNGKQSTESLVVKLSTVNEFAIEKIGANGFDVQNKEMLFFEEIAPQIKKILTRIGEENLLSDVMSVDRMNEVLVFEDLKAKEFTMADRMSGLDDTHVQLALAKLAKFHAASLIIHQKHPRAFLAFDVGMFSRKLDHFNDAFISIYEILVEEVATWPGYEKYARKMRNLQPSFIEAALRCFDNDPGDFCVLNHGDMWTNNLMFKYDDKGKVVDAVLIDFQFAHWASPALDLMHLLYTSLSQQLFDQDKIKSFFQFFYYELRKTLAKFDYDLSLYPTLHAFQLEVSKRLFYGMVYTFVVYPIMTSDDADNDFIAHHSRDDRATNFKRRMVKGEKFQGIVKKMLPVFDRKGLLDFDFTKS